MMAGLVAGAFARPVIAFADDGGADAGANATVDLLMSSAPADIMSCGAYTVYDNDAGGCVLYGIQPSQTPDRFACDIGAGRAAAGGQWGMVGIGLFLLGLVRRARAARAL